MRLTGRFAAGRLLIGAAGFGSAEAERSEEDGNMLFFAATCFERTVDVPEAAFFAIMSFIRAFPSRTPMVLALVGANFGAGDAVG
jgi:hypothetical protein